MSGRLPSASPISLRTVRINARVMSSTSPLDSIVGMNVLGITSVPSG